MKSISMINDFKTLDTITSMARYQTVRKLGLPLYPRITLCDCIAKRLLSRWNEARR